MENLENTSVNNSVDNVETAETEVKTYTQEEVLALIQKETDKRVTQALNTQKKKYEKELGLVEPTDAVSIVAKDGSALASYLIGDTITYNGGYKQVSEWAFENEESANNNPTTLGEAIKQTYAKVDKANKNIEIVTSEAQNNKSEIAAIRADTDSISASVVAIDKKVNESTEALNGSLTELTSKVNATMTSEEIKLEIATELSNGVDKVVTEKGYTFDDEGLKVTSSGNSFTTTISENGMIVREGSKDMLVADNEGVTAVDLHAKTFLIIGNYSRLQNYPGEKRTACFWIGG